MTKDSSFLATIADKEVVVFLGPGGVGDREVQGRFELIEFAESEIDQRPAPGFDGVNAETEDD